jgi:hypothetical protein
VWIPLQKLPGFFSESQQEWRRDWMIMNGLWTTDAKGDLDWSVFYFRDGPEISWNFLLLLRVAFVKVNEQWSTEKKYKRLNQLLEDKPLEAEQEQTVWLFLMNMSRNLRAQFDKTISFTSVRMSKISEINQELISILDQVFEHCRNQSLLLHCDNK